MTPSARWSGRGSARQAIFDKPEPPDLWVVLDESVLHRLIGSPKVMYDQLTDLADMSGRSLHPGPGACRPVPARTAVWAARCMAGAGRHAGRAAIEAIEGQTISERRSLVRKAAVAFDRCGVTHYREVQSQDLI